MGQARRRRERFFREHPYCCFCGGEARAEEIEHLPPRIMFLNKHRPEGFEFPICIRCNRASRKTDELVSFLAKFAAYRQDTDTHQDEFDKQARAVLRNCPESFDEILSGRQGKIRAERELKQTLGNTIVLSSVGKKQIDHINLFSIKLTAGTYYAATGNIAPKSAKITTRIYTQFNYYNESIPRQLDILGPFRTMEQGSWSVSDQFSYRYALTDDRSAGGFEFLFHNNLRLVCFLFIEPTTEILNKIGESSFSIRDIAPIDESRGNTYPTLSHSFTMQFP